MCRYLLRCLWQHYVNYNVAIVAALCCLAGFVCASILLGFFHLTSLDNKVADVIERMLRND